MFGGCKYCSLPLGRAIAHRSGCKVRPISFKLDPKNETSLVGSECTVRYRVVAY